MSKTRCIIRGEVIAERVKAQGTRLARFHTYIYTVEIQVSGTAIILISCRETEVMIYVVATINTSAQMIMDWRKKIIDFWNESELIQ